LAPTAKTIRSVGTMERICSFANIRPSP
jgi:hypothetical protein